MNLRFGNGTPDQQRLAREVVDKSHYPFDQVDATVTVRWEDVHMEVPLSHSLWAGLTSVQTDGSWLIRLRTDLGNPNMPPFTQLGWGGSDQAWFYETLTHELGHVMQGFLNTEMRVVGLFGALEKDWAPGHESITFTKMVREGDAETFKDVFAAMKRFPNRTGWKLPQSNYAQWGSVYLPGSGGPAITYTFPPSWAS